MSWMPPGGVVAIAVALALGPLQALAGEAAKPAASANPEKATTDGKATRGEVAKADRDRKKPLQRCDQLKDKAQIDCLEKARERIVEARQKREASGKGSAQK